MNILEIRNAVHTALDHKLSYAFVTLNGQEAVIRVRNYSRSWYDKATIADFRRIAVY